MRMRILMPFVLCSTAVLFACSASRPMAHLIINNDSQHSIPIKLSVISENNGTTHTTIRQTLTPGLQEFNAGRFAKGMYQVSITTSDGQVSSSKKVSLDTERWIIINYTSNDSLSIYRKYGYVDTSLLKKIDGRYTGIDMFTENRRLPTL